MNKNKLAEIKEVVSRTHGEEVKKALVTVVSKLLDDHPIQTDGSWSDNACWLTSEFENLLIFGIY